MTAHPDVLPLTDTRARAAVVALALLGAGLRVALAAASPPVTGDPLYSYAYRATLLAAGDGSGTFLMWHPPGYPMLLAGLSVLTGRTLPAYSLGVGVSVLSHLVLVVAVDRLLKHRLRWPVARVAAAGFLSLYEPLVEWGSVAVTEPPYLALVTTAVALADAPRLFLLRGVVIGLLLGGAVTLRLEAVAPAAGLLFALLIRSWKTALAGGVGFLLAAGWLLVRFDYLAACMELQRPSYTIPPGNPLTRAVECAYYAVTRWLPFVLLPPYWLLVGAGLGAGRERRVHFLLAAVVLPTLLAVGWTVMHKRTGLFLLPAAAVWIALGLEVLARRCRLNPTLAVVAFLLAVVADLGRVGYRLARDGKPPAASVLAARALADHPPGPVWAFGSEPEVYAVRGWPVRYPFWDRGPYNRPLADHPDDPAGFVQALQAAGFRYLAFAPPADKQPLGDYSGQPTRRLLEPIIENPAGFGLTPIAAAPGVYVFALPD